MTEVILNTLSEASKYDYEIVAKKMPKGLKSEKEKMKHVHVVSHHPANDDSGDFFKWSEILAFGVTEHQIGDQNVLLQTKRDPWDWAKDHPEPGIAWIWNLLDYAERDGVVKFQTDKFDCSDAGMLYWWMTGADRGGHKFADTEDMKRVLMAEQETQTK